MMSFSFKCFELFVIPVVCLLVLTMVFWWLFAFTLFVV